MFGGGSRQGGCSVRRLFIVILTTLGSLCLSHADGTESGNRPNVVWVLLDACRADALSCYGNERPTSPVIDRLAERGVRCENNFSQAGFTTWSVPSYMTGKYFPVYCLDRGPWRAMFRQRSENELYLSEILHANGYQTACFSVHAWFSPNSRIWKTFEKAAYVPPPAGAGYAPFETLNEVLFPWLEESRTEPFFLYLHTLDTHFPHIPIPGYESWFDAQYEEARKTDSSLAKPPFSDKEKARYRALLDCNTAYADACLGRLLDKLEQLGLVNTIVIISSDHGDLLGEDGQTIDHPSSVTTDELFHVPLVMAGPGIPSGVNIRSITENVDIVPTVLDLLGISSKAEMQGKSLMPLFDNPKGPAPSRYAMYRRPSAGDDFVPILGLRSDKFCFEWNAQARRQDLWSRPDSIVARQNVKDKYPEIVQEMNRYMEREIIPLWQQYAGCPRTNKTVFTVNLERIAVPADAWDSASTLSDNKWQLVSGRLKSAAFLEDAPPITFPFEVPDGTYRLQLEADSMIGQDAQQGSCFLVKVGNEADPKVVSTTDSTKRSQFLDIGTYTISGGRIDVTLDEGDRTRWAVAGAVRFIPEDAGHEVEALDNQTEMDEQLKALGYLGD
ncbi:MAG TPA: sulfatase [Candidatus Hydrogenedentes bacterium]|nr:sulfatase [Candidatus Hydrogenedentota bacterium]HPG67792.1 sulfatase [Candidatus Hydrogenedentota bacterium]